MKKLFLIVALLLAAAPASAQVIVKCRTSGGSLVDCSTPLNNGYVNWASPQSIGTVSAPAAIHATTFYGSAAGLTNVPASSVAGSLSGVTINCSSNTCSNVSLTAAVAGILPIANGGTNSNVALNNSRAIVSSGGAIIETASACGTGTVLNGGTPPNCTATPIIGTALTVPRINSSGLILDATTGNNVQISINSTTVQTVTATGVTLAQPLAMSSKKITGLATATASGDALGYPWITGTYGSSVLGSVYTLSAANGMYSDTGLSVTLPSAGTYRLTADVRAEVLVSAGAGAFIECEYYNSTDAAAVSNSERIMAQANQVNVLSQGTWPMNKIITVAASKTIKLYCSRNSGTTYTTSDIPSDANGRTEMSYVKINDT